MQPAEIAAAAIHAAQPVKVQSATGGSLSSWITAGVAVLGFLGVWLGVWPKLKALNNDRLDNLDEERRGDMRDMRERLKIVEEKASLAEKSANTVKSQLSTAVIVISLLASRIRKEWPNDPILEEVNELMKHAMSDDMGFSQGIAKILAAGINDK